MACSAGPGARALGRLIIGLNLLALAVLLGGALVLNELRSGLINARIDSLTTQGELIANASSTWPPRSAIPSRASTPDQASDILQSLFIPRPQRARLFDAQGNLLADSHVVADRVESSGPAAGPQAAARRPAACSTSGCRRHARGRPGASEALAAEVAQAAAGRARGRNAASTRWASGWCRCRSRSSTCSAVLGVLTLEAGDIDQIIAAERKALLPFILIAIATTLISSLPAQPPDRPAGAADWRSAADRVRLDAGPGHLPARHLRPQGRAGRPDPGPGGR